jgi:hypothetical protein
VYRFVSFIVSTKYFYVMAYYSVDKLLYALILIGISIKANNS